MISARVAPFAALHQGDDLGLLVRAIRLRLGSYLARFGFFGDLAFLPALRVTFDLGVSGVGSLVFSLSIASSLMEVLLDCRHIHHSGSEKWQAESSAIR